MMQNNTFEAYLKNYQNFNEDQKNQILEISPRLRMLRDKKTTRSIIQAYPYDSSFKIDPTNTIKINHSDEAVSAYESYVEENSKEPAYLLLNQEIIFIIADQVKNVLHNYQILSGESSEEVIVSTDAKPRFAPSVYEKICFVTGAAQGLGQGIAKDLAEKGAYTIIADLNDVGANETAFNFNQEFGEGTALPVKINVADEEDVQNALKLCVAYYGGLDVLVSNAGVVRAGSLDELSMKDFSFVTAINYNAYFITVKHSQKIMKMQHEINPDYWMDIIQINSKSGLVGSKNNFAYAGSKFGGIGLTQSFALELADYHIKVNAICPGNNLDGPLWSDPVNGLYVQYLNSGKVKGAKTVEDVREFYLDKVPMRKGVVPSDLGKAICYLVEQENETGQALPVSGGQEMLN